ncbi:MAG: C4-dicarboxylic acid transporter DauA [Anaeromyxobacter sp.]|nr:C4-dicarboxylic acid transporter DauA [Anaeromyxobacter sp.]MBL0274947.1 C4-dicarboxylic acid transporter DauA [Anaeromyxobacter sp.]
MALTRYLASQGEIPLRKLPAAALRAAWREGYGWPDLRADLLAGLVVGVVALPLAMALAIAVGVAPQYGLYTSIVTGAVIAVLGGSRMQVSGPTAAFIVILAPIYTRFGMGGLLLSGFLAGLMLVAMALLRAGKLIEFIPNPVTTGFTAGIAVVIATLQVKDLLGLRLASAPEHYVERLLAMWDARGTFSPWELVVGASTFAVLRLWPRFDRRIPAPIVALPAAALLVLALGALVPGLELATIATRFQTAVGGVVVAGIPQLPPLPLLPWLQPGPDGVPLELSFATLRAILPGAFAVAMLGAIESLLSAVVADGMARTRHDPDAELLAQGVGNMVGPFFGGIPATGAIARTATNVRSGARSPLASVFHAATVLLAVLALAPALGFLPMAALAALLVQVAWNMSEARHFGHIVKVAPKSDVATLLACFTLTVLFDMVIGVSVGMVLAALLFMRRMADVTQSRLMEPATPGQVSHVPAGVLVYDISGALFFGAAQKAMSVVGQVAERPTHAVVLRMDEVHAMDVTGLVALESAVSTLAERRCLAILSGLRIQPRTLLARAGFEKRTDVRLCDDLGEALELAAAAAPGAAPARA